MIECNSEYYDKKWTNVISLLPVGGQYRYDLRQYGYDIIKKNIDDGSTVFDYACGLGILDMQLIHDKKCKVYGCDYSEVAINYLKSKLKKTEAKKFEVTEDIFGNGYKYILAVYILEHLKNPTMWIDKAFYHTESIIIVIPSNFNKTGEHTNMAWSSWDGFYDLMSKYKLERLDVKSENGKVECLYPLYLPNGFKHPIFKITEKKK